MIGVGVGVGLGNSGGGRRSPAWLHARLIARFGAELLGLWIGEDLVVSGTDVTSWPGRVGATLQPVKTGIYRTISSMNGRKASVGVALEWRGLTATSATAPKAMIAVAKVPALPITDACQLLSLTLDAHALAADGTDMLTGTGWTHYINGVAGESLTGLTGTIAIIEGNNSSNSGTGTRVGCSVTGTPTGRCWVPDIALAMSLSAAPDETERADTIADLRAYGYR